MQQKISNPETVCCHWCQKEMKWADLIKWKRDQFNRDGRVYCSPECGQSYRRKISSETMAKTNKMYASERMKEKNPMYSAKSREKMRQTLIDNGYKPAIRGGNGKGLTEPQKALFTELKSLGAKTEHIVLTNLPRPNKYKLPTHYKIDIALPDHQVAIEIDGGSHGSLERQAQDRKKDSFLNQSGWKVLRFSNEEVMASLTSCVQMVMSTI